MSNKPDDFENNNFPVLMGSYFDKLSKEEKHHRIKLLSDAIANSKEQEIDFNQSINALLDPEKLQQLGEYNDEYNSYIQLPFSTHYLYLKINSKNEIYFRINTDMEWLTWDGTKHNYSIIKSNIFKLQTQWQRDEEMKLINMFVSLTHSLAICYFKNIC